jgi:RNA polymerase sigma factor (sigma-70 family)
MLQDRNCPPSAVVVLTPAHRRTAREKRDKLITQHLDLVAAIARSLHEHCPPSIALDDLIQTGNLALIIAAERFSPQQHGGAPFSAYARQRIRGAMLDSFRRRHWTNATMEPAIPDRGAATVIETELDQGRLRRRVRAAVQQLPAAERAIVAGHRLAELELKAVARIYGISYSRAKELHRTGMAALREQLAAAELDAWEA